MDERKDGKSRGMRGTGMRQEKVTCVLGQSLNMSKRCSDQHNFRENCSGVPKISENTKYYGLSFGEHAEKGQDSTGF